MSRRSLGRVWVTGGAGAIGSRLIRELLCQGAVSITVVDDLSSGHEWLLPEDPRVQFFHLDVCEIESLRVPAKPDTVFHLAAFFANQNSIEHPESDLHTNGLGTLKLLEWARQHGAGRVVYASAGCSISAHKEGDPIVEDSPISLHMSTPYQITKALGEFYCNYFSRSMETVRCRFFNSYGPGEVPGPYRNVIPNFIWRAMHGESLWITGTGEETRDFIYVEDLVKGLIEAACVREAAGEAFNLGTGIETRVIDLAEMIISLCQSRSRIEFGPRRDWDHSLRRCASLQKASTVLGFRARVPLAEGLQKTVEWFLRHETDIAKALSALKAGV